MDRKKQIPLRLDMDLYNNINAYAKRQHLSVNSAIANLLSTAIQREGSLEQRLFIGLIIPGNKITTNNKLIEVKGVYYRFKLLDATDIDRTQQYRIINVIDNVLILSNTQNTK